MTTVDRDNDQGRFDDGAATIENSDQFVEDAPDEESELWDELDEEDDETVDEAADEPAADDEQLVASDPRDETDPEPAGDEPADEPAKAGDPFANATPEQRAAWSAAQAQIAKLEQSDRSQRGRLGAMQRQVNDLMAKISSADAGERTPVDAAADKAKSRKSGAEGGFLDTDEYKEFADEYPEVAGPIGKVIASLEQRLSKHDERFSAEESAEAEAAIDEQTNLLTQAHPDWQDVLAADEDAFVAWLPSQPRHVQEAAYRNAEVIVDADEAADVFGRFKAFRSANGAGNASDTPANSRNGKPRLTGKRQRQLESATGARGSGPGVATGIPEDGDEQALWDAFDKLEQRQAQRA